MGSRWRLVKQHQKISGPAMQAGRDHAQIPLTPCSQRHAVVLVPLVVNPHPLTHMTEMERCEVARCRKVSPVMGGGAAVGETPGRPLLLGPAAAVAAMCSSTVGQRQRFGDSGGSCMAYAK